MKYESQLQIVTAAGVPPFTVNQTAAVINLNADLLDGQHGSYYQSAANLNAGTLLAARLPAFTGDVSSTVGTVGLTLASVGTAGTYRSVTTDAKGRVTAGTNPTTLAGYGITDALTKFSIPETSGTGQYVYLGRWSSIAQNGQKLHMTVVAGAGYNAVSSQNQITQLFFKTSNGTSSQAGSTGVFYGDGFSVRVGETVNAPSVFRTVQIDANTFDIYGSFGAFTGNSFYVIATASGTWTHAGTLTSPSGNYIDITPNTLLHAGNFMSYALPLTGGTLTGGLAGTSASFGQITSGGSIFNRGSAPSITNIQCSIFNELNGIASAESLNFRAYGGFKWQYWDGSATWMQLTSTGLAITGTLSATGAITQNGNQVVHAGNVSTYALPIGGGTVTGQLFAGSYMTLLSDASNMGAIGFNRRASDGAILNPSYGAFQAQNSLGSFLLQMYSSAGAFVGSHTFSNNGNVAFFNGTVTAGGNQVLHAGNYTSYAIRSQGGLSVDISNTSLDTATTTGFFRGNAMTGAPDAGWWFIIVESHDILGTSGWVKQTVTAYGAGNSYTAGTTFIRVRQGGTSWNAWIRELDSVNYNSFALPLTGGTITGQLSVNGTTASDILRLYTTGSTVWKLGVTDASGTALNITADFGNFTINKTNGNVTTPGAFISGYGSFASPGHILGDAQYGLYVASGNLYYKSGSGGIHYWRNKANTSDTFSINDSGNVVAAGSITGTSFAGLGTGLTGTATSLNIGGSAAQLGGLDNSRYHQSARGTFASGNWDSMSSHGTYKIQHADFSLDTNPPPASYGYGICEVTVSEVGGENRIQQMYWPHTSDNYSYQRMRNNTVWTSWYKIYRNFGGIALDSANYGTYALPLSGGTLTGAVSFLGTVYNNVGGARFFAGSGGFNYLYTNTSGMVWRNQADTASVATLTDAGAFNAVGAITQAGNQVLHAGNVSTYALPIGGGTVTGQLTLSAATDPAILLSGGVENSSTHLYTSIGGVGKIRIQRDGIIKGLGIEVRSGANVNAGSAVFSVTNAGAVTGASFSGLGTGLTGTATSLSIGGSSTSCTGSAAQLNGQAASFYLNAGNLNAGTLLAARLPALTGDVTTTVGTVSTTIAANAVTTAKIINSAVTYAKIQNVGVASVLGNTSASVSQAPQEITFANLNNFIPGAAKAWATFSENASTGAITVNANFGISSVTRIQAGVYQVNFSTAFSDINYAVSGAIGFESNGSYLYAGYLGIPRVAAPKATGSCMVTATYGDGLNYNARYVHVVFHR
jgi:hypothetical protein